MAAAQIGGAQGKAEAHAIAIGHEDMARTRRRLANGQQAKASAEERMGRVDDLDLLWLGWGRVLERGIMLWGLFG
jgi:hypothetical protein